MEDKFFQRVRQYESVVPLCAENEIPRDEYLKRLTKAERQSIINIFENFETINRYWPQGFMALAVGSTTFNNVYWDGLEEYLAKIDSV